MLCAWSLIVPNTCVRCLKAQNSTDTHLNLIISITCVWRGCFEMSDIIESSHTHTQTTVQPRFRKNMQPSWATWSVVQYVCQLVFVFYILHLQWNIELPSVVSHGCKPAVHIVMYSSKLSYATLLQYWILFLIDTLIKSIVFSTKYKTLDLIFKTCFIQHSITSLWWAAVLPAFLFMFTLMLKIKTDLVPFEQCILTYYLSW